MTAKKDEIFNFRWEAQSCDVGIEVRLSFYVERGGIFEGISLNQGIINALPLIKKELEHYLYLQKQLAEEAAAKKLEQALELIKCHHPGIAYCNVCCPHAPIDRPDGKIICKDCDLEM